MRKFFDMNGINRIKVLLFVLVITCALFGCNKEEAAEESPEDTAEEANAASEPEDEYSKYIRDALSAVSQGVEGDIVADKSQEDTGRVVYVETDDSSPQSVYVSAADESLPEESGIVPEFETDDSDSNYTLDDAVTRIPKDGEEATPTPTGSPTPETFEVGTCCIYINGETDAAYGSEIVAAINKARTDLGYPALTENAGLSTCADRRTREIASYLSHMRPNALPFYSLAPEYFKAEMLAIDNATPPETVDAWITDPYSRTLVFTNKYTSVGASCFKCNDLCCVVVAYGY